MTTLTADSQPTLSFPDASTLDLIIPHSSDFDVESHLRSGNQLVSRDNLFFGMHLVPCLNSGHFVNFHQRNCCLYMLSFAAHYHHFKK